MYFISHELFYYFQEALGAEGISLQFRHIASHLLWCCASTSAGGDTGNAEHQELLHEVIHVAGYFVINNHENQVSVFLYISCEVALYALHTYT